MRKNMRNHKNYTVDAVGMYVSLKESYSPLKQGQYYRVVGQGKDYVGVKYRGGTISCPVSYIENLVNEAETKPQKKDIDEDIANYEEIAEIN